MSTSPAGGPNAPGSQPGFAPENTMDSGYYDRAGESLPSTRLPSAPEPKRFWRRFRLRHKLALSLVIAALLPVLVASWVGAKVVLRSLESGLKEQSEKQIHVGLNLVLRQVERLGFESMRLSRSSELASAFESQGEVISHRLAQEAAYLPPCLLQIADKHGQVLTSRVIGGMSQRFTSLAVPSKSELFLAGAAYERRVTIEQVRGRLVVRAVAPWVDERLELHGVILISVPMDEWFAETVKAALGSEVAFFVLPTSTNERWGQAVSTFRDPLGQPLLGFMLPPEAKQAVSMGRAFFETRRVNAHDYEFGFAPLVNLHGERIGVFAVGIDRAELLAARGTATRSLALGAAGAFVFALGLAGLLSRRITRPVSDLHEGAIAIARGDLEHRIHVTTGDEIGDLATAFSHMTAALKENQRRLAARMREIVALHDAGRAVSAVLELDQVLRKVVDSMARVLHARVCALWVLEDGKPRLGAARVRRSDLRLIMDQTEISEAVSPMEPVAHDVLKNRTALRLNENDDSPFKESLSQSGEYGSLVATPLERKGAVWGVVVVARGINTRGFSDADLNLLATFADQAAAAIENATLYGRVRAFNEELEAKVKYRTQELVAINQQLAETITELRDTQNQLILSERLAGLGQLVAGVAHEINSPTAAIRGSAEALSPAVVRLGDAAQLLAGVALPVGTLERVIFLGRRIVESMPVDKLPPPAVVRRHSRELSAAMAPFGFSSTTVEETVRALASTFAIQEHTHELVKILGECAESAVIPIVRYLSEVVNIHRNRETIEHAILRIQRIVGGLRSYSHLDQEETRQEAFLHEGIEGTLVLLDHLLARGITVHRRYGDLPKVPVFVDELNQVWTNLVHNAVQALLGAGEITIFTSTEGAHAVVRIVDNGPGIPPENLPKIWEPFFTTKPRGEGTGLGLGIVRQIVVDRHGGEVSVESQPGRTCFVVRLPLVPTNPPPVTMEAL